MYVTIRKYPVCKDIAEASRIAVTDVLPALRTIAGFRSYLTVDTGNGTAATIGVFDSKEAAENGNQLARTVVMNTALKDLVPNPPETIMGEVLSGIA
jgi:hypothetical protein